MKQHIWQGNLISDSQLSEKLEGLENEITQTFKEHLSTESVLSACNDFARKIRNGECPELAEALNNDGCNNSNEILGNLGNFLSRESLEIKLNAELGTITPFEVRRVGYCEPHFEAWSPMGVLVHITAGNSPIVAPMAAVEGLLSGNINIVKVASNIGEFSTMFLEILSKYYNLGKFIYMLRVSSSQSDYMQKMLDVADCVSAWGGEEAIRAIREITPQGVPVVAWGHKISFAYITPEAISEKSIDDLVSGICRNEQQSCSSPQCVMIDTQDTELLRKFGHMLAEGLERARDKFPILLPDSQQMAEITAVTQLYKADLCFQSGEIIEAKEYLYRVLISDKTYFMPSPLFRTIWLSPLPQKNIVSELRVLRQYLQTSGLACTLEQIEPISKSLYRAGITRITPIGSMSGSYNGEPHDGLYALPRFVKRVSFRTELDMGGMVSFVQMEPYEKFIGKEGQLIETKKEYPPIPSEGTRVVMKSGGTTGESIYCSYTEKDFKNYIVKAGASALLASGLDIKKDVVADLFKAGNLYGGMNSFISIFDELKAAHLNIGGLDDYALAANYVIKGRANALLGAPSYIVRMLKVCENEFKSYGRINKIFYGGEPLTNGQKTYLENTFGIKDFHSMVYGANETGTMGYPCEYCNLGEFHLPTEIQQLEILKMNEDNPVEGEEVGRFIFTGYKRENGHTERYEIGDMGCWIEGKCSCGITQPRFKLIGRYGDIIRIGGTFLNYIRLTQILSSGLNYSDRLQLLVSIERQEIIFCMENCLITQQELIDVLVASDYDSIHKTISTGLVSFVLRVQSPQEFTMNNTSMKLRPIIYTDNE